MKASANNAKASDPAEDFISTKSQVADGNRTQKMWAMNEKTKVRYVRVLCSGQGDLPVCFLGVTRRVMLRIGGGWGWR